MKRNTLLCFAVLLAAAIPIISCNKSNSGPQVEITTDIRIERFEQELFLADPARIAEYIKPWEEKYGIFFRHFCQVTGLGDPSDEGFPQRIQSFVTDRNNFRLYKRTIEIFPNLEQLTSDLNASFSNYSANFPGMPLPEIYSFISGLSRSAITDDGLIGIGLDRYLGQQEDLYREAGIYNYLTKKMYPEKVVPDCLNFWSETEFPFNDSVNNLIANMIYQGRALYFTKQMLKDSHDSLALGFSFNELRYLRESEKSMWAFLVDHKLLFNTDRFTINKFILDGPFTTDFGRNSPAKAAVWIGYRITEAYMNRNTEISLQSLMMKRDYMEILNGSAYNP